MCLFYSTSDDIGSLKKYTPDTLFVVYCAGPHCNGTEKAAIRLAKLGRPVKKMIGGIKGCLRLSFPSVRVDLDFARH
jgi:rhodanese-related sulfurtransferase